MTRVLLHYIVPLLLPTAAYFAWAWWMGRRAAAEDGGEAPARRHPWFWLAASGLGLVLMVFVATALLGGNDPKSIYHPPRFEGGEVKPGHFERKAP